MVRGIGGVIFGVVWMLTAGMAVPSRSQDAAPVAPETGEVLELMTEQPEVNPLVQKFEQGGRTMWFLALLSLAGVTFALERAMQLRRSLIVPDGFLEKADTLWQEGRFKELPELCDANPSTLARMVRFVSDHRKSSMALLSEATSDIARREFRRHQRRAYPLAVIGTLSPLLGLMGTVFGLMESFEAVAVAGTMDDPSILANSIAKALVTTASGLVIAVPALVLYHVFKSRTGDLLDLLDEKVSYLMNSWYLETKPRHEN